MVFAGENIKVVGNLKKVSIDYLYNSIKNPRVDIKSTIEQLRIIKSLDMSQYSIRKTLLPYFVCGIFSPPIRQTVNFNYTEYFILDIDHISEKGMHINELKDRLSKDQRVRMCFISPGDDGLKLLFKLNEKCFDAGLYSLFYKSFASKFSFQYNLNQVIDIKTCDVTRACFISYDPFVYYNSSSETIDIYKYVDINNDDSIYEAKCIDIFKNRSDIKTDCVITDDVLNRIKERLGTGKINKKLEKDPVYVPEELEKIIDSLVAFLEEYEIEVSNIVNISYGKKIQMRAGLKRAEINLFYGKKGFNTVISPKTGTSKEFNFLAQDLIKLFISEKLK